MFPRTVCGDVGLPEVQVPFRNAAESTQCQSYDGRTIGIELESFVFPEPLTVSYEIVTPLIVFGKRFAIDAYKLPVVRDDLWTNNAGLASTMAVIGIAVGLCVVICVQLQKRIEPYFEVDYYHSTMVAVVIQKFFTYKLNLDWTIIFLLLCSRKIFPILHPKTILLENVTKAVLMLILYIGGFPASALPGHDILQADLDISLSARQSSTVWTIRLEGWPNTGYCVMMHFGNNKEQTFCMLVDTGSSNTAVAATTHQVLGHNEFYDLSLSGEDFVDVGKSVKVTYSSGEWSGYLVKDKVGFEDYSMEICAFSLITSSTDFFIEGAEWVGILGMAYKSLAKPDSSVGTVWDSIRESNGLQDVFSLQLCPPRESTLFPGTFNGQGGYMTLGGTNSSLYSAGKGMYYTSIVEERFFSVLLTKIAVEDKTINLPCKEFNNDKTIVDSGTTDIFFPTEVFHEVKNTFANFFKEGLPLDVPDEFWMGEQKLLWQATHVEEIYQSFPTLYLSLATADDSSREFCLAVVPQLYLRQVDVQAGEADPVVCPTTSPCDAFTFGVKPRALGTVIGGNAMLGYYTVFDRENKRVGFAESTCDYRSSKTAPYISGPYAREPEDCEMPVPVHPWNIVTYICGALTTLFGATMMALIICVRVTRRVRYSHKTTLHDSGETKRKAYCGSTTCKSACGLTICCGGDSQNHIDEGYVSEMNASSTFDHDDDDDEDEPMTPTTPDSVLDCRVQPTPSQPAHTMIVGSTSTTGHKASRMDNTDMTERKEGGASKATKKKKRRKQKKNHPVMESATPSTDRESLCIAFAPPTHKSMPGTALVRAANPSRPALSGLASMMNTIMTDEYTGELHYPETNPRTFINV